MRSARWATGCTATWPASILWARGTRRTELGRGPAARFSPRAPPHESLYGTHTCGWHIGNRTLHVDVRVAANNIGYGCVLPVDSVDRLLDLMGSR